MTAPLSFASPAAIALLGTVPGSDLAWLGKPILAAGAAFLLLFLLYLAWALYGRPAGMPVWYRLISRTIYALGRLIHRLEVCGEYRIPKDSGCIIIANHSCGADPPYLAATAPAFLSYLVAKEIAEKPYLRGVVKGMGAIPVNRSGVDTASFRTAKRMLEAGRSIAIFPEGAIQMDGLVEARPGAALLAARSGVPVIPVYIHGAKPSRNLFAPLWHFSKMALYVGEPFLVELPQEDGAKQGDDIAAYRQRGKDAIQAAARLLTAKILEQRARAYAERGVDLSGYRGPFAVEAPAAPQAGTSAASSS